jgi:hypothetical protein
MSAERGRTEPVAAQALPASPALAVNPSSPTGSVRTGTLKVALLAALPALVVGAIGGVALRDLGALDFFLAEQVDLATADAQRESAVKTAFSDGKSQGVEEGAEQGYEQGKSEGYQDGLKDGLKPRALERYIDDFVGVTVNAPDAHVRSIFWSNNINGDNPSGICVDLSGYITLDEWRWALVRSNMSVALISDDNFWEAGSRWCYNRVFLLEQAGELNDVTHLAVYVKYNGTWDRKLVPMPRG